MTYGDRPDDGRGRDRHDAAMEEARPPTPDTRIRVVLAMRHARTREAISEALEFTDDIVIAGESDAATQVAQVARAADAQVVLIDLALVGRGTAASVANLVRDVAPAKVVTVGLLDGPSYGRASLEAGAAAHLITDAPAEDYRQAVLRAAKGPGD
jgi:DNA-binding NarL/FixJ family response regulator